MTKINKKKLYNPLVACAPYTEPFSALPASHYTNPQNAENYKHDRNIIDSRG